MERFKGFFRTYSFFVSSAVLCIFSVLLGSLLFRITNNDIIDFLLLDMCALIVSYRGLRRNKEKYDENSFYLCNLILVGAISIVIFSWLIDSKTLELPTILSWFKFLEENPRLCAQQLKRYFNFFYSIYVGLSCYIVKKVAEEMAPSRSDNDQNESHMIRIFSTLVMVVSLLAIAIQFTSEYGSWGRVVMIGGYALMGLAGFSLGRLSNLIQHINKVCSALSFVLGFYFGSIIVFVKSENFALPLYPIVVLLVCQYCHGDFNSQPSRQVPQGEGDKK